MAILDTRIDDRLIHGQVCGYWIPQYSLQRIAIVDDDIVNDETRKTTLKFGMPENCKLSIFGSAKAADKFIRKIDDSLQQPGSNPADGRSRISGSLYYHWKYVQPSGSNTDR